MSTVALIQLSAQVPVGSDDAIDLATERIDSARSADLIVLPEVWYPGYFSFDSYTAAASQTPSMMERFSDIARSAGTCLHVGSLIEADGDRLFNTSVMFGPDGQVIGRYRKMHLFGYGSREQEMLTPGSDVVVVDTPLGRLGMAVCYDLRFPELFRRMTEKGAIGFVVASAWPHPRVEAWTTLLRARAIENQAVMIACNGVGPTDSARYSAVARPSSTHGASLSVNSAATRMCWSATSTSRRSVPPVRGSPRWPIVGFSEIPTTI